MSFGDDPMVTKHQEPWLMAEFFGQGSGIEVNDAPFGSNISLLGECFGSYCRSEFTGA